MSRQTRRFYNFGAFLLDTNNRRLTRPDDGETVPLTPKEFEVLLFLLENAGDVVAKDTLLDAVWKDSFVDEGTLMRNISWLRKKLGAENPAGSRFIETVPKFGYRFAAAVVGSDGAESIVEEGKMPLATAVDDEENLTPDDEVIRSVEAGKLNHEETTRRLGVEKNVAAMSLENRNDRLTNGDDAASASHHYISSSRKSSAPLTALVLGILASAAIAFAVYQNFLRKTEPKTILAAKVAPFSGLPGREDMPAFSPDGRQIVFVWNGGDDGGGGASSDIYVKFIGKGEPVRLTNTASEELYPVFSPDGSYIAFVRVFPEHEEVILIPAGGGAEHKICELNSGRASLSFSPDGKYLAVVDMDAKVKSPVIFLLDRQTGNRRRLTDSTEFVTENTPRFSPDGKSIAFLHYISDSVQEMLVVPSTGGTARQLTFDKTQIRSLTWSADSKRIIFVSHRQNNQPNLWQIEVEEGASPELISTNGKNIKYTAASPDGKSLSFVEESDNINIRQITPGDKSMRKFIDSTGDDVDPQFSPDGTRVLFASERSGSGEIWISDANGNNQRQLTDSAFPVGSPRFSPDGKFIAYNSQNRKIYIIPADGGPPRQLSKNEARDVLPVWSADGRWIYFISNQTGDYQLWKTPSAGGGDAVQITKHGAFNAYASPDGKWIYYSKGREIPGLWRVPADGGEEIAVPELADAGFWRSWTVTTAGIYYVAYAPQPPYKILFYDFANGRTKEVALIDKTPLKYSSSLGVSFDGKTILYAQTDQETSSIMLAELGNSE